MWDCVVIRNAPFEYLFLKEHLKMLQKLRHESHARFFCFVSAASLYKWFSFVLTTPFVEQEEGGLVSPGCALIFRSRMNA